MTDLTECRVCGVPHVFTDEHGWRARNGHPWHAYDRRPREYAEGQAVTIGEPRPAGYTPWFGGEFLECDRCRALVVGKHDGAHVHTEEHKRLDDELAALWQALEQRRTA